MKYIDLFCGMGSFHQALIKHECVMACDIDASVRDTYEVNYGLRPLGDITKIMDASKCDVLTAGFPCQSFSYMGKHGGMEDERGQLIFDVFRLTKLSNPDYVILENVKNILKYPDMLTIIYERMNAMDYTVKHQLLNCWEFGIPQNRQRVFFVCVKRGLPEYFFPKPGVNNPTLSEYMGSPFKKDRIRTIRTEGYYSKIDDCHNWANYELENGTVYQLLEDDCKHLQGFGRDFVLKGNKKQRFKQLGNTIPTNLTKAIISQIEVGYRLQVTPCIDPPPI